MDVKEIPLNLIKIEGRFREDLGDLDELARSIGEYGLLQPVTLDTDYRLLAGGRRYYAVKMAGLDTIPAILRPVSGDADRREIELIENIHRKDFTWIERARLEKEIYTLKGTYRAAAEVLDVTHPQVIRQVKLANAAELFPEIAEQKTEGDAWKLLKKLEESVVVKELMKRAEEQEATRISEASNGGELTEEEARETAPIKWADSHYEIYDAIEGLRECHRAICDFAEVDPPYAIDLTNLKRGSEEATSTVKAYTEISKEDYPQFLKDVSEEVFSILQMHSFCVWWFGPSQYANVLYALQEAGFQVNEVPAIWDKGNQGQTQSPDTNLANCYEMFFVARKGRPVIRTPGRSNVFRFNPVVSNRKIHTTERPVDLIEELLKTFASPGQRVLCPFLGSGNTLRACYKSQMVGFGWDLNQDIKNRFLLRVQEDVDAGKKGAVAGGEASDPQYE